MATAIASPAPRLTLPELTSVQRANLRTLPFEIVAGLRMLRDDPAPPVTRPEVWDQIATDAIMLAVDGWAGRALDLGWAPMELFGCAADPEGDDSLLGLAGKLAGGRVLALTSTAAHVLHGADRRTHLRRRQIGDVTFLWSYGR